MATKLSEEVTATAAPERPEAEPGSNPTRVIRVVVDLLVDEDIWAEKKQEGATDKYLVGEVRKALYIQGCGLWYDHDIQDVRILEEGGTDGS